MKGLRMTIAKHMVATILDTLAENDFVNVLAVKAPSRARPAAPQAGKAALGPHWDGPEMGGPGTDAHGSAPSPT